MRSGTEHDTKFTEFVVGFCICGIGFVGFSKNILLERKLTLSLEAIESSESKTSRGKLTFMKVIFSLGSSYNLTTSGLWIK